MQEYSPTGAALVGGGRHREATAGAGAVGDKLQGDIALMEGVGARHHPEHIAFLEGLAVARAALLRRLPRPRRRQSQDRLARGRHVEQTLRLEQRSRHLHLRFNHVV